MCLCFCQEMHGTHEKTGYCCDAFVCAVMSGQFDHGKRKYGQRLE